MGYNWVMRPSPVGDYSNLPASIPHSTMKRFDKILIIASKGMGIPPPNRGIIDGDDGANPDHKKRIDRGTSVMRWDHGDILWCKPLFFAPEPIQDEIVVHELTHVFQNTQGKMDGVLDKLPIIERIHEGNREAEADRVGMLYALEGKIIRPPRFINPLNRVSNIALEARFKDRFGFNSRGVSASHIFGLSCATVIGGTEDIEPRMTGRLHRYHRGSL